MDGMNRWLVTASLDGSVKVWQRLPSRSLYHTLQRGQPCQPPAVSPGQRPVRCGNGRLGSCWYTTARPCRLRPRRQPL